MTGTADSWTVFVDSNVLIDLLQADPQWGGWSEAQLATALAQGVPVINAIVYAEVARSFASVAALDAFLAQFHVEVEPIPRAAAFEASRAHQRYRRAGGARVATLPDFFIAAHAQALGAPLLTRDATRVRSYFPGLSVIAPA